MKKVCCFLLLVAFCTLAGKGWHFLKDGFSINRTLFPMVPGSVGKEDSRIEEALNQPYFYLARGRQCYAFESADKKYVLKLPRYDKYLLSFFLRSCRFSFLDRYREKLRLELKKNFSFILESFRISSEELPEDTAVIYLHLHKTDRWKGSLIIKDPLGQSHRLDPDNTAFILQEKKPILVDVFQECLKKGDRKGAEEILDSFLSLVSAQIRKGIYNKDRSFMPNFGWADGKAYLIDIGGFCKKGEGKDPMKLVADAMEPVRTWLGKLDPEIHEKFEEKIEALKDTW